MGKTRANNVVGTLTCWSREIFFQFQVFFFVFFVVFSAQLAAKSPFWGVSAGVWGMGDGGVWARVSGCCGSVFLLDLLFLCKITLCFPVFLQFFFVSTIQTTKCFVTSPAYFIIYYG